MKLRNKTTTNIKVLGEIVSCNEHGCIAVKTDEGVVWYYRSLAELNAEWEDYEEPKESKEHYFIAEYGSVYPMNVYEDYNNVEDFDDYKQIGNYFDTREEAEKAVEKLKAWKRLKDDGLKIRMHEMNGATDRNGCFTGNISLTLDITRPVYEDVIQLLFGGEE